MNPEIARRNGLHIGRCKRGFQMKGRWYFDVMRYKHSFALLPSITISWNSDLWAMISFHWLLFAFSVERWSL